MLTEGCRRRLVIQFLQIAPIGGGVSFSDANSAAVTVATDAVAPADIDLATGEGQTFFNATYSQNKQLSIEV
ncbi:MAG: hypothetical protein V3U73_06170 [bacterium]